MFVFQRSPVKGFSFLKMHLPAFPVAQAFNYGAGKLARSGRDRTGAADNDKPSQVAQAERERERREFPGDYIRERSSGRSLLMGVNQREETRVRAS